MFNDLFGKYFKISFLIFIIVDILSFFSYQNDYVHIIIFILLFLLIFGATLYKLEYGLYILLGELFIGSQGHLISLDISFFDFSIRMAIFFIVFLVWLTKLISGQGGMAFFKKNNQFLIIYLLLFIILLTGVLSGLLRNQLNNVFFDVNGWLFFAAIPVFYGTIKSENAVKNIISLLFSATCYISLKTLIVLIIFAYPWPINISTFYNWLRDSRIGEITRVTGSFYRIFFQAQIYALIGLIMSFFFLLFKDKFQFKKNAVKWLFFTAILSSTAIIACLSRSFWLGVIGSLVFIFYLLIFKFHFRFLRIVKIVVIMIAVVMMEIGFLYAITGNLTHNWIKGRLENPTQEAATMSRISQLGPLFKAVGQNWLLGAGFGKTVTYFSNDPRILAKSPSGVYETYAFEWGYLDIWLKVGIIGLMVYLYLYYLVFKEGIKLLRLPAEFSFLILALMLGLVGVLVTSIFSPYLNHPLGIGFLLLISAIFYLSSTGNVSKEGA